MTLAYAVQASVHDTKSTTRRLRRGSEVRTERVLSSDAITSNPEREVAASTPGNRSSKSTNSPRAIRSAIRRGTGPVGSCATVEVVPVVRSTFGVGVAAAGAMVVASGDFFFFFFYSSPDSSHTL